MTVRAIDPRPVSSNQAVATPWEFISAVHRYLDPLYCDVAANRENRKARFYLGLGSELGWNSLVDPWPSPRPGHWLWLNPPFKAIADWLKKVHVERKRTLVLVPASVGTQWYTDHVFARAAVKFLSPRIAFTDQPFPKDLMLLCFDFGLYDQDLLLTNPTPWNWKPWGCSDTAARLRAEANETHFACGAIEGDQ